MTASEVEARWGHCGEQDRRDLSRLSAILTDRASNGAPLRFGQMHRPYPLPGGGSGFAGWVDYRFLDGVDEKMGWNWAVTLDGTVDTGFNQATHIQLLPADDTGPAVLLDREDPWQVWADPDHQVLACGRHDDRPWETAVVEQVRRAPNGAVYQEDRLITLSHRSGQMPAATDLRLLADLADQLEPGQAGLEVFGVWSGALVTAAIARWVAYWIGADGLVVEHVPGAEL